MSAGQAILGPDPKIRIAVKGTTSALAGVAAAVYAIIEGTYSVTPDIVETTDSEATNNEADGGSKSFKAGLYVFSFELTAQDQVDVNPFSINSVTLFPGNICAVHLFHQGLANNPWIIPYTIIEEFTENWRVQGSEPNTIKIRGKSTAYFLTPGGSVVGNLAAAASQSPVYTNA